MLLAVFMLLDVWGILALVRKSRFDALLTFGSVLDWIHWVLMSYSWKLWYDHVALASRFKMMAQIGRASCRERVCQYV